LPPPCERELPRKSAVFAAEQGDTLIVKDRHIEEALAELVVIGGALTQKLLDAAALREEDSN
jgi:hypothetical protein